MNASQHAVASKVILIMIVAGIVMGIITLACCLHLQSQEHVSKSDYPVATSAAGIQDLLLRDALLELIGATKLTNSAISKEDQLVLARTYVVRVDGYYEAFKKKHEAIAAERVKGPIAEASQEAVDAFAWAKTAPDRQSRDCFMILEQFAKKLNSKPAPSAERVHTSERSHWFFNYLVKLYSRQVTNCKFAFSHGF